MTNNGVGKIGGFGSVIYDSGNDTLSGKQRIGISATEIELLDDIPPSSGTGLTRSGNITSDRARGFGTQISSSSTSKQNQQNNYQILSSNREQSKPNAVYQDDNSQQLNFAVDQLLEKYAPDAIPQNLLNNSNNRRVPPQVNVVTARDQPPVSTFQTNAPPPSSSSAAAHNYSTIIRPNTGQTPQTQTQNTNNKNIRNGQTSTSSRPTTNYDSFQHVIPPLQQQQQQQPQLSVPVKTKNGNHAQVVPGKLYTLDDDPLHLLYDRQNTVPINSQQPTFQTTFQPASQPSTIMYTNATQRYPHQSIPTTTNPNLNGIEPFDLGNLIKRVQQEYLREIQPFVSSVKFVEKDREYGQSLTDIGFVTPVSVRKGFTRQADDILRRSFGRQAKPQPPPPDNDEYNTYSEDEEDDINQLHSSNRRHPLENMDSKQSFTSVTSASTNASGSDIDARYASLNNRNPKVQVHNQGTSPPPQVKQTKTQAQVQSKNTRSRDKKLVLSKFPAASLAVPSKPIAKNESDEEDTTTTTPVPATKKLAKRISSGQHSDTSSGSTISDDQQKYTATYNEHELPQNSRPNPSEPTQALATIVPVVKPSEEARQRVNNIENRAAQRSEDIHPTPPMMHSSTITSTVPTNNRTPVKTESEESDGAKSGSDNVTESEDEDKSAAYNEQTQAPSITRSGLPKTTPDTTVTRGPATPQRDARATTTENPSARSRTTPTNNTRQPAESGTNPNIHFVPPDQRSAANDRGGPTTSTNQAATTSGTAQTGSNRFFKSDNVPKSGGRRSIKDAPASIGDRIKSIFRRK